MPTVAVLLAMVAPAYAQVCGDADGNGNVTVTDGVQVLRAAAGLGDCDLVRCDADGSGTVTVTDGVNVLRAAAGLGDPTGCAGGGSLESRRTFLHDLASDVAIPGYRTLVAAAVDLQAAVETVVTAPGADALAVAQDAWRATRRAWKATEAFRVGPSETQHTSERIDWPAANPSQIDIEIAGGAALSSSHLDTLEAPKVGFQALEYFLFDPASGDAGAVARLQGADNARRRAYLLALAVNVRERTEELRNAWEPSGGDFGADLVASGIGGDTFPTLKEAFDAFVNRMILTVQIVEEDRLGAPLGIMAGGVPRPDLVESPRSGDALPGVVADLQGVAGVYEEGVDTQVVALSPQIDAEVRQRIDDAIAAVQAMPTPLADAVVHHHDVALAAYEAVRELRRVLMVEVAGVLDVTLPLAGS